MPSKAEKTLLDTSIITFFDKKKEYRSLSNFWECEIVITDNNGETRIYESGEHCFHGEKYIRLSKLTDIEETRKIKLYNYGIRATRILNADFY